MDSNTPAVASVAKANDVKFIGYGISRNADAPSQWLGAFSFNWAPYMIDWTKKVQAGTFKPGLFYWVCPTASSAARSTGRASLRPRSIRSTRHCSRSRLESWLCSKGRSPTTRARSWCPRAKQSTRPLSWLRAAPGTTKTSRVTPPRVDLARHSVGAAGGHLQGVLRCLRTTTWISLSARGDPRRPWRKRRGQDHPVLGALGDVPTDAGRIVIGGAQQEFRSPADALAAGVGMVYQHFKLVPTFTVAEHIELGSPRPRGF